MTDTIQTTEILDMGAKYVFSNHPDHLAKKIVLAQLLVNARHSTDLDSAFLAFKFWSTKEGPGLGTDTILRYANEENSKRKKAVR